MTKKRRPPGRPPSAITKAKRYKALSNGANPHSHQHQQQHQHHKVMSPHTPSVIDLDGMPIVMNVNRKIPLPTQPDPSSNNSNNNSNKPVAVKQPSSSANKHPNVPPGDPLPIAVAGALPGELRPSAPVVAAKPSATTPSLPPASSTTPSPASGLGTSPTPSPASSSPRPLPTVPAPQQNTMTPTPILPAPTRLVGVPPVTASPLPQAPPPRPASNTKTPGKSKPTKPPKTKYKARITKQPKNSSQQHAQKQATEPQQHVQGRETQPTRAPRSTEPQQLGQTIPDGNNATTINGSSKEESSIYLGNNSSESKVIIFQCSTCRSVVADSTLDYEFDADCTTVSLEAASNVLVNDNIDMCKQGADAGCTFRRIVCSHCSAALGRVYVTTFPEMDHQRNRHTFDTDSLITYRIGEGKTPKGENVSLLKHSQKAADANHRHQQELQKQQQQQQQESNQMSANNNDAASVLAIRDLEDHVDAVTNAVNSITDAVRQIRFDIKDMRKSHDDVVAKVVDGENALGHVQNLILVWDERIRDIDGCKDTLNRIIPVIHSLDNKRYAVIENCADPPVPRITAPAAAAGANGSPTSSGKSIPQVDTTPAGAEGMRATADRHRRRHQHEPIHNQSGS